MKAPISKFNWKDLDNLVGTFKYKEYEEKDEEGNSNRAETLYFHTTNDEIYVIDQNIVLQKKADPKTKFGF